MSIIRCLFLISIKFCHTWNVVNTCYFGSLNFPAKFHFQLKNSYTVHSTSTVQVSIDEAYDFTRRYASPILRPNGCILSSCCDMNGSERIPFEGIIFPICGCSFSNFSLTNLDARIRKEALLLLLRLESYSDYYCKRTILCLASSKILTPPPSPSPPGECVLPPQQRRGGMHNMLAGRRGGWGVNILEDARHRIGLLQ